MDAFDLDDLRRQREESGALSFEFLRSEALSCTIYELPAGGPDPQQPHKEDEVYVLMRGRAKFRAADEEQPVGPGSFLFVAAGVPHRFEDIEEDLTLLVVFAPPKS
jgi:mannose-6-phosphate isomerase-like protein (cupin superfamily)